VLKRRNKGVRLNRPAKVVGPWRIDRAAQANLMMRGEKG